LPKERFVAPIAPEATRSRKVSNMSSQQPSLLLVLGLMAAMVTLLGAAPAAGSAPIREVTDQGFLVRLDLSAQVLGINIPEDKGFGGNGRAEAPIEPTLQGIDGGRFVSASMLAQKAKQFDDGLYAAAELAVEDGVAQFAGKAPMLRSLAERLRKLPAAPRGNALEILFGACRLGQVGVQEPQFLTAGVESTVQTFLADALHSKPIGFYTWSKPLTAIFQQDRLLQSELKGAPSIAALVKALHDDAAARTTYEATLALASKLTNPLLDQGLIDLVKAFDKSQGAVPDKGVVFFPASRAHETDLIKKLYGNRPIPPGFSLVDEMIKRIRAGGIALEPTAASGWYDYQTWSLEPLVVPGRMPEAPHLRLSESYTKQLLELFKGILALTRETHIKQLEIPMAGSAALLRPARPQIFINPDLAAEPLPTSYQRRADSYQFVRAVLEESFGAEALRKLHRLTAEGPVQADLATELDAMEALFRGAAAKVSSQIGVPAPSAADPKLAQRREADLKAFQTWISSLATDPDLGRDVRMMVPLFFDVARKKTKVWAFLGWSRKSLNISFAKPPKYEVFQGDKKLGANEGPVIKFNQNTEDLAYPITAEVYVTQILNRDEFRKHCDTYKTQAEILKNLK
jgi:hypothetical protein